MLEDLRRLIELQRIDSALVEKTALIDSIPKKVTSVEQPLLDARSVFERHKQRYESILKKKKDREGALDDVGEKIKKLKTRIMEIKTNKEYQAHLKEIESVEKEQRAIEDEILSFMEALDGAAQELSREEAMVRAEEQKIEAFKKKLQGEVTTIEQELQGLRLEREKVVGDIDGELYRLYFKQLEANRGLAVVEAKDEVCRGCNMNIPPQLFVELKTSEHIIQCPQCNRILFWIQ